MRDIRGRRFAFGPRDDEVLHQGALAVLAEAGITPDDLAKEVVPIPGVLQFHISSLKAAKEVVYGVDIGKIRTEAGVIEEEDYDSFPNTGGRWLPLAPTYSKNQFRVLARGKPVCVRTIPDGPVVASREADPELVEAVRDFLLSTRQQIAEQDVADLGMKRFRRPPADTRRNRTPPHSGGRRHAQDCVAVTPAGTRLLSTRLTPEAGQVEARGQPSAMRCLSRSPTLRGAKDGAPVVVRAVAHTPPSTGILGSFCCGGSV